MLRWIQLGIKLNKLKKDWLKWKEGNMLTISQIFKSKTVWTLILMAIYNGTNDILPMIHDPKVASIVNDALTILAFVFRIAPKQHLNTLVAKDPTRESW